MPTYGNMWARLCKAFPALEKTEVKQGVIVHLTSDTHPDSLLRIRNLANEISFSVVPKRCQYMERRKAGLNE